MPVRGLHFEGVETASPAPGVLEAIRDAAAIIIAPSNPLLSIGPILAVAGIRSALVETRACIAAVSPIVGGAALKGPADRLLRDLGYEASALEIGRLYADFLDVLVVDNVDQALAPEVQGLGVEALVTDTIMSSTEKKANLARAVLDALGYAR